MAHSFIDITGHRFGRLTVVERELDKSKLYIKGNNCTLWLCICDCGNEKYAYSNTLRTGLIQSCGCLLSSPRPRTDESKTKMLKERIESKALATNNKSGHRGIFWNKLTNRWGLNVTIQGKQRKIGSFTELDDAVAAKEYVTNKYLTPLISELGKQPPTYDRKDLLHLKGLGVKSNPNKV